MGERTKDTETPPEPRAAETYLDLWDRNMSLIARYGPPVPHAPKPER